MKLIIASKIEGFAQAVKNNGYEVSAIADSTDELKRIFARYDGSANTLLITEKINTTGSLVSTILEIHELHPEVRIIFLATGDLTNKFTVNQLNMLASKGIYDLFYQGRISIQKIIDLIENPKTEKDCEEIFETYNFMASSQEAPTKLKEAAKAEVISSGSSLDNVIAITSVKPGTGKSFISSNLAVTLAKYGKKENGTKPKILLLEGDLQTLSIYTLFGIKDDTYNLKTSLRTIREYFEAHDYDDSAWFSGAYQEKEFIKRSCIQTSISNLYIMEGHNFDFNDISEFDGEAYYYLVNYLAKEFDLIVIDTNSSFQHPTTDPIFQLSKDLYFVYTTDFNNLKLNIRYKNMLTKLGLSDKIRYVLNKSLVGDQRDTYQFGYSDAEIVGSKLKIDFDIPNVDMSVILNSTYRHKQIAMDNTEKTLSIRIKFLKLAYDVMSLGFLDDIEAEIENLKKNYKNVKEDKKKKKIEKKKEDKNSKGLVKDSANQVSQKFGSFLSKIKK